MTAPRRPLVRGGWLVDDSCGQSAIAVGTPQWCAWLAGATAFVVEHPAGEFTVRREGSGSRRGSGYWRAYRTVAGRRRRVYLGRAEQLTAAALDHAARRLSTEPEPEPEPSILAPLPVTKVRVPPPRDRALPRPQVTDLLDRATRLPLTLLCAPAGYGKTTALATWAAGRHDVAWLSLDQHDSDLAVFCRHLAAALADPVPSPPETVATSPPARRRWIAGLVNALAGRAGPTLLVLDDYQRVDSAEVHEAVTHLVDHLPPQARLVVATRHPPSLPLARWRVQHRVASVGADQLRLTEAEAEAFLADVMGLDLAPQVAADLHARTEGWVAGLQLAALALHRGVPAARAIGAARSDLDTYLITEVLDRLPAQTRDFVLRTSVLNRLTGDLCDALTGRTDGTQTLRHLVTQNLFLVPLDELGRWYRYHHLFSRAAAAYARQREPALIAEAYRAAAAWHQRSGDLPVAVEYALSAGAHRQAAALASELAVRDGGVWLQEVRVQQWLAALPEPVLARHPVLCLLVSWSLLRGTVLWEEPDTTGHEVWLDRADTPDLPPELRGVHGALVAYRQFLDGAHEDVAGIATRALDLLAPSQTGLRVHTALRLIDVLGHGAAAGPAARAEREFAALSRAPHEVPRRLDALLGLAAVQLLRGELRRAEVSCEQADALAAAHRVEPSEYLHATPLLRLELLLEWNRVAEAAAGLAELQDQAAQHPDPGVRLHGWRVAAQVCGATGDEAGALRALDEMEQFRQTVPGFAGGGFGAAVRRFGAIRRAGVLLAAGYPAAAESWLERAQQVAQAGEVPPGLALYEAVVSAQLALAQQDPANAAAIAAAAATRLRDVVGAANHIRLRVTTALAQQASGDQQAAVTTLAGALALAGPGGLVRPFVEPGASLRPLLWDLAQRVQAGRLAAPRRHLDRVLRALRPAATPVLTAREREVLGLFAAGLSAPQAARRLGLAASTVRSHVERINAKLDTRTQAHAVSRAYELGLLPAG